MPPGVKKRVASATSGKNIDSEKAFGTQRKNATATAFAWKNRLGPVDETYIIKACHKFYRISGYQI